MFADFAAIFAAANDNRVGDMNVRRDELDRSFRTDLTDRQQESERN